MAIPDKFSPHYPKNSFLPMRGNARCWLLLLTLLSTNSQAINCFDQSPGRKSGGPLTAELVFQDLSLSEHKQLESLLKAMEGFWTGTVTEINCKGKDAKVIEEKRQYKVHARGTSKYIPLEDTLSLHFRARLENSKQNVERPDIYRLLLTPKRLRLDKNNPAGDVKTLKVLDDFLVFTKKNNLRNPSGGVVTQEIVRTYTATYNTLSIEYHSYTNGKLVSMSQWTLHR